MYDGGRGRTTSTRRMAGAALTLVLLGAGCAAGPAQSPTPEAATTPAPVDSISGPDSPRSAPAPAPSGVPVPSTGDDPATTTSAAVPDLVFVATVDGALSMSVATNGVDPPVAAWIAPGEVGVAVVDMAERALIDMEVVNGDVEPLGHPIERPGLAVRPDGTIDVAFTSFHGSEVSVYYTRREAGTWQPARAISGDPQPETNLVHIGVDDGGDVALAWLEDSTLSIARLDAEGEPVEFELVDESTCDCCNPAPTFVDDALVVAYRNYEVIDDRVVRDIWAVRALDDEGAFATPVVISDDHWFLDACPFSGPHAVVVGEVLVVAFMDARQSRHPDQDSSGIWVDVSADGGRSFGTDVEVSGTGINRWPVMAVDDEQVIHLVWEVPGASGGIAYAASDDVGATFSDPVMILANAAIEGSATSPSLVYDRGSLILTWTDRAGGRVGIIDLG